MIIHSAKEVKYDVKNFIEKNIDQISASLDDAIKELTSPTIRAIYTMTVSDDFDEPAE